VAACRKDELLELEARFCFTQVKGMGVVRYENGISHNAFNGLLRQVQSNPEWIALDANGNPGTATVFVKTIENHSSKNGHTERETKRTGYPTTYMHKHKFEHLPPLDFRLMHPNGLHSGSFRISVAQELDFTPQEVALAASKHWEGCRIKNRVSFAYKNRWRLDMTEVYSGISERIVTGHTEGPDAIRHKQCEIELELMDRKWLLDTPDDRQVVDNMTRRLLSLFPPLGFKLDLPFPRLYLGVQGPNFRNRDDRVVLYCKGANSNGQQIVIGSTPAPYEEKRHYLTNLLATKSLNRETLNVMECEYVPDTGEIVVVQRCDTVSSQNKFMTAEQVVFAMEKQATITMFKAKK
jgi:hypothetical protein